MSNCFFEKKESLAETGSCCGVGVYVIIVSLQYQLFWKKTYHSNLTCYLRKKGQLTNIKNCVTLNIISIAVCRLSTKGRR